jgi:hypothetical protein
MKCSQTQKEFHSNNQSTKMTETPETNACIKEYKHIRFLEEDHWSLNGKFTYTHPIVALCRRLERQRDGLKSAADCASDLLYTAIAERDEAVRSCHIWQKGHSDIVAERDLWQQEAKRWKTISQTQTTQHDGYTN